MTAPRRRPPAASREQPAQTAAKREARPTIPTCIPSAAPFDRTEEKSQDAMDLLIGRRLKALRRRLDLSQSDIGRLIGVTFQQIQKYEHGRNKITVGRLDELARRCGIPICFFLREWVPEPTQAGLCCGCKVSTDCASLLGGTVESLFRNMNNAPAAEGLARKRNRMEHSFLSTQDKQNHRLKFTQNQ